MCRSNLREYGAREKEKRREVRRDEYSPCKERASCKRGEGESDDAQREEGEWEKERRTGGRRVAMSYRQRAFAGSIRGKEKRNTPRKEKKRKQNG